MLQLRCPKCQKTMLYHSSKKGKNEPSKKCVFCGRNFTVKNNIVKRVEKRPLNEKKELCFASYGKCGLN